MSTFTDNFDNEDYLSESLNSEVTGGVLVNDNSVGVYELASQTTSINIADGDITASDFYYTPIASGGGTTAFATFSVDGISYTFANGSPADEYGAVSFNGTSSDLTVSNPDFSSIGTGNFTVFFKFRTTNTTSTTRMYIIEKWQSFNPYSGLVIAYQPSSGELRGYWGGSGTMLVELVDKNLSNGEWHYGRFTRTSTTSAEIQVDTRTTVIRTGMSSNTLDNSRDLHIGSRAASANFYDGDIGEIIMFPSELGSSELSEFQAGADLSDGSEIFHYKFYGDYTDSGPNGYNLSNTNTTLLSSYADIPPAGELLKTTTDACYNDGINDSQSAGDSDDLSFTGGAFSLFRWVYLEDVNQGGLFSKRSGTNYEYDFTFENSGGELYFRIYQANTSTSMRIKSTDLTGYQGNWILLGADADGTLTRAGMRIIVNGDPVSTTGEGNSSVTSISNTSTPLYLGWASYNGDRFFKGMCANAGVFNKKLSDAEWADLYENGYPDTSDPNLVSYWTFNGDYTDSVGSNNLTNDGGTFIYDQRRPEPDDPSQQTFALSLGESDTLKTRFHMYNTEETNYYTIDTYSIDYTGGVSTEDNFVCVH